MKRRMVGNIEGSSDLQMNEGFIYQFYLSRMVVSHHSFDRVRPSWQKDVITRHTLPFFVIRTNFYCRILDRSSPSFSSWPKWSLTDCNSISWGNKDELYPVGRLAQLVILHSTWMHTTCNFIQYDTYQASSNCDCSLLSSLFDGYCLLRMHLQVKDCY
jgi:hypothetical protein